MLAPVEFSTLYIGIDEQRMVACNQTGIPVQQWAVSTASNGCGNQQGSGQTPLGWHRIRAWIGDGAPSGTVFVGRRATGECYSPVLAERYPARDWILTRILWLCGEEPGINRGGRVDSMRRFIYIHGTPDSEPMGVPRSHGCIRMRNQAIIDVFPRITRQTRLCILPSLSTVVKD